ncbi:hypothetical protein [Dyadobacter sp. CY323]|uniref:hypothetical protein n=1 Tax=Dyadobacter sp. CY323 TaxID=2907302 RepID=UPI001F17CC47|nr:hypothetical protein [Dyadobacter sp. CY323]MCE6993107.1 hypothetical protein [Dyadobacter sp. CY323]
MKWPFVSRKKYNDLVTFCSRQQAALQSLEEKVKAQDEQITFTHNLYNLYRGLFAEASRKRDGAGRFTKRIPIVIGAKP